MALLCFAVLTAGAAGCAGTSHAEHPFRVDTVVRIPVNPTQPSETQPETSEIPRTDAPTQPAECTSQPVQSTQEPDTGSSRKASGKTARHTSTSSEKATLPPQETQAPPTQPQETQAPPTQPPETQPTEPETLEYDISGYVVGNLEYAVQEQINACRAEANLAALSMDTRLCAIASVRAYEASVSWSHTRPDGRGYGTVLADYGYGAGRVGENLAYSGAFSAKEIVDKWMESEGTRQNLLGDFATVGIGIYNSGGLTYLACLFVG